MGHHTGSIGCTDSADFRLRKQKESRGLPVIWLKSPRARRSRNFLLILRTRISAQMHSPLPSFENHLPRRVITGRGASQSVAALCRTNGWTRLFIVSDAGVAGAGLLGQGALPVRAETVAEVPPETPLCVGDHNGAPTTATG